MNNNKETYEEKKCILNIRLLKIAKMFEIFDPKSIKIRGYNVYQIINFVFIFINSMATVGSGWSVYCCLEDYYNAVQYLLISVVYIYNSYKTYYLIRYSDAIWSCIDLTSIDFLSYGRYQTDILRMGRAGCIRFTNFLAVLWVGACFSWMISPLLIKNYLLGDEQYKDGTINHLNVFNILFPVSIEFYNNNFILFYVMECIVMAYNSYILILFDIVIFPFFMTIYIQLKTISMAYKTIGYRPSSMVFEGIFKTNVY